MMFKVETDEIDTFEDFLKEVDKLRDALDADPKLYKVTFADHHIIVSWEK